ncbi:MAG: hypothetical protein ACP5RC_13450, partial [Halothiobacillaceae bacterium]
MTTRKQGTPPPGVISDAIEIIRNNSPAMPKDFRILIKRIECEQEFRAVIEKLARADPGRAVRLVRACYEADQLCDGFASMVAAEKAMPER